VSAIVGYFIHNFVTLNMHKITVEVSPEELEAKGFGVSR
jgi:hypothetical protein